MNDHVKTIALTVDEVANQLRVSRRTVYQLIADGHLPSIKVGRTRRITRQQLEEYVEQLGAGAAS